MSEGMKTKVGLSLEKEMIFLLRTDDEENYTLMLFDEIPVERTDDEQADIQKATQLQADWLSELITKEPKFWFWLHRRFKNDHPEIYR